MKKKKLAIFLAALMSATMFAGVSTISATKIIIPDDAPKDIEIPDKLPIESILKIDDSQEQSRDYGNWDLYLSSLSKTYISGYEYRISYIFWQYGQDDLYDYSDWNDQSWIKLDSNWDLCHTVEHDESDLFESGEDYPVSYYEDIPPGIHWFHHYVDADNNIPESGTNPESNNDILRLWNF